MNYRTHRRLVGERINRKEEGLGTRQDCRLCWSIYEYVDEMCRDRWFAKEAAYLGQARLKDICGVGFAFRLTMGFASSKNCRSPLVLCVARGVSGIENISRRSWVVVLRTVPLFPLVVGSVSTEVESSLPSGEGQRMI
jgi:hypothetical protein